MQNKIALALFGALCYNITQGLAFTIVRLQANALGDFRTLGLVVGLPNFALVAGSTFWGFFARTILTSSCENKKPWFYPA